MLTELRISVGWCHLIHYFISSTWPIGNVVVLYLERNDWISRQNRLCHTAYQCYRSLHQYKHWRQLSAVEGGINRGWYQKSPKARLRPYNVRIVTGLPYSPNYWSAIWQILAKRPRRGRLTVCITWKNVHFIQSWRRNRNFSFHKRSKI